MKSLAITSIAVSLAVVALAAQDPVKTDAKHYSVLVDNAAVRVLKASYAPGESSTMHQHPDHIAVALSPSKARFALPDGKTEERDMAAESAMYVPAGSHNPTNTGTGRIEVIVVEFKAAKPGAAVLPATRAGLNNKLLAEGARGNAQFVTADPTFAEPAGTKHDYDQVVIALSGGQGMSLSIDGKPAKTNFARGDVSFIGRGVGHEAKNTGGKPATFVIVSIK